jgi:hypothetical protein
MKKEDIIYVTAQTDVPYFHWQVELYITIKYIEIMKDFIKD